MSLMDGISQAYKLTAQINNLQSQENADPEVLEYNLQKNFSSMLDDLIAATSYSSDESEDDKKDDPFAFIMTSNQTYTNYLLEQQGVNLPSGAGTGTDELSLVQNLNLSSDSYLNSLSNFENSSLALLNFESQLAI